MSARESGESFWGALTRELIVVSIKQVGTMRNDVVEQRRQESMKKGALTLARATRATLRYHVRI